VVLKEIARHHRIGYGSGDPGDKWRVLGPPPDNSIGMPRPATARMTGAPGNRPHRDPYRIFPNDPPHSIRCPGAVRILPHRSNKRFFGSRLDSDGQIDLSHAELVKLTPAQIDIEMTAVNGTSERARDSTFGQAMAKRLFHGLRNPTGDDTRASPSILRGACRNMDVRQQSSTSDLRLSRPSLR